MIYSSFVKKGVKNAPLQSSGDYIRQKTDLRSIGQMTLRDFENAFWLGDHAAPRY
jgi:hypothetical protein